MGEARAVPRSSDQAWREGRVEDGRLAAFRSLSVEIYGFSRYHELTASFTGVITNEAGHQGAINTEAALTTHDPQERSTWLMPDIPQVLSRRSILTRAPFALATGAFAGAYRGFRCLGVVSSDPFAHLCAEYHRTDLRQIDEDLAWLRCRALQTRCDEASECRSAIV